jgi:hypothetical protein
MHSTSVAIPYCGVAIARGIKEFRWSGTHNESMWHATALW